MHEPRQVHALEKRDRKSTSSYCTYHEENLVTWQSKGQNVIPCSSVESEYEAMDLVPFLRVESSWASSFLLLSLSLSLPQWSMQIKQEVENCLDTSKSEKMGPMEANVRRFEPTNSTAIPGPSRSTAVSISLVHSNSPSIPSSNRAIGGKFISNVFGGCGTRGKPCLLP